MITRSNLGFVAGIAAIVLVGVGATAAFIYADQHEYDGISEQAASFAARMGIVHGGCSNEACSGLRDGKPINYFCTRSGCVFETAGEP